MRRDAPHDEAGAIEIEGLIQAARHARLIEAEVVAVELIYAPAPVGVWRVTIRFHGHGTATFVHAGIVAPRAGDVWRIADLALHELIRRGPDPLPEGLAEAPDRSPSRT